MSSHRGSREQANPSNEAGKPRFPLLNRRAARGRLLRSTFLRRGPWAPENDEQTNDQRGHDDHNADEKPPRDHRGPARGACRVLAVGLGRDGADVGRERGGNHRAEHREAEPHPDQATFHSGHRNKLLGCDTTPTRPAYVTLPVRAESPIDDAKSFHRRELSSGSIAAPGSIRYAVLKTAIERRWPTIRRRFAGDSARRVPAVVLLPPVPAPGGWSCPGPQRAVGPGRPEDPRGGDGALPWSPR